MAFAIGPTVATLLAIGAVAANAWGILADTLAIAAYRPTGAAFAIPAVDIARLHAAEPVVRADVAAVATLAAATVNVTNRTGVSV